MKTRSRLPKNSPRRARRAVPPRKHSVGSGGPGKVFLVGAGPGDPKLITVRGLECLKAADVVIHDRLVSPELLRQARRGAELVDVGKTPGRHPIPQPEINALLVRHAQQGRQVCRLKGGDPFLFGRGGEEVEALAAAGIPYEVVPGITAALGAAASSGIPLTHRDYAASLTLVTGHPRADGEPSLTPRSLPTEGTLVFYMGMTHLERTTARLVEDGRPATTPVAVIQAATTPEERVVTGTLADIAARCREEGVQPPALILVGEVVALREKLAALAAERKSGEAGEWETG